MFNFILGTLFGIVIATTGVAPLARMLDNGVAQLKTTVHEQTKQ
jgi:hypothetical protein